ncbi:endopeptidase La [bacterium]|nr:endopeptidase La [bacterium]
MVENEKVASDQMDEKLAIPSEMPILPLRDLVLYPFMIVPLFIEREKSLKAVDKTLTTKERMIFLATQKESSQDLPEREDFYTVGTVGIILRLLRMPDQKTRILVQGIRRGKIKRILSDEPTFIGEIETGEEEETSSSTLELEALMRNVKANFDRCVALGKTVSPEIVVFAANTANPGQLADLMAAYVNMSIPESQKTLEMFDPFERLKAIGKILEREVEILEVQKKIHDQTRQGMEREQRDYYLRQQMKTIQDELGESAEESDEIKELKAKIEAAKMSEEAKGVAEKQLSRLKKMHPESSEGAVIRTYLDWLVELPWAIETEDSMDVNKAKEILDEDHYDLEDVKERILEFLAVKKLKPDRKGSILCFVGPPGVGKTSLGKSIARALGRKFIRISLGGIRDEAEIRGHRRTYVGALPGKIIHGIKQAGSCNPVFMMDEVDKIGTDFRGDPSSALLEVLDPEQNNSFRDHYLEVSYDLSKVMFITTANMLEPIQPAFLDRMEVLHLSGYSDREKLKIAKKYLIPRQIEENGLKDERFQITEPALKKIIMEYTREAGLRNLEREIAVICRKVAKRIAEGKDKKYSISAGTLYSYLGSPKYIDDSGLAKEEIGKATGLAWTTTGGEVLYIEVSTMEGKGNLTLTGQLGDVMKESAQAAMTYARTVSKKLNVAEDFYYKTDIHIHIPAGAVPKDGPSAGITLATALISALAGIPIDRNVAMTGEITVRGEILPIGGLKQKVLAAKRRQIKTIIVPSGNKKDIEVLPKDIKNGLKFHFLSNMDDVLEIALVKEKQEVSGLKS